MLKCCRSEKRDKLFDIALLGPYLGKNRVSMGQSQNQVNLFLETQKEIINFRELFILSKYKFLWKQAIGFLAETVD